MRVYHRLAGCELHGQLDDRSWRSGMEKTLPLDHRNIPNVKVVDDHFFEQVDADDTLPPEGGWAKAFQANSKPPPRSWSAENVMGGGVKSYVSRRAKDSRHSIGAMAAMVELTKSLRWTQAGHAWQSCALMPGIIRHRDDLDRVVFVLACSMYAVRTCPVHMSEPTLFHLDFEQNGLGW